jgi:SET domain-containing protein
MIINKYNLLENLNSTYCIIGRSKIHGIGVIAIRDIPKGVDPFPCMAPDQTIGITEEELRELPKEVSNKIKDTFVRVNKTYHVYSFGLNSMGVKFHINHCNNPNVAVNEEAFISGYNPFMTLRKIKKGEELCWDYTISNGDNILNQFNFIKNE